MFRKKFKFYKRMTLTDGEIFLFLRRTADADIERGYVPSYYFDICDLHTNEKLGRCDLRIGHNENIFYAGNIGYFVEEEHRGNHYALKACRLLLPLAKKHAMGKVIITCNPENFPSRRTCELLGAKYIETVRLPPHNELYQLGERRKCIYELEL